MLSVKEKNDMTYKKLLTELLKMDDESLNQNVTIQFSDEYYPVAKLANDNSGVLDDGHSVLILE